MNPVSVRVRVRVRIRVRGWGTYFNTLACKVGLSGMRFSESVQRLGLREGLGLGFGLDKALTTLHRRLHKHHLYLFQQHTFLAVEHLSGLGFKLGLGGFCLELGFQEHTVLSFEHLLGVRVRVRVRVW